MPDLSIDLRRKLVAAYRSWTERDLRRDGGPARCGSCDGESGTAVATRNHQYGERTVHLDGCVEVDAAYYGAPPGWIGRRVQVQPRRYIPVCASRTIGPSP
jgi:hypothetical protein